MKKHFTTLDSLSLDFFDGSINEIIYKLRKLEATYGSEVGVHTELTYDDYNQECVFGFLLVRPETAEEKEASLAKMTKAQKKELAKRRELYEELKREFEE